MYIFKQKGDHKRKSSVVASIVAAKTFPEGYAVSGFFLVLSLLAQNPTQAQAAHLETQAPK